jgi:hypothetical protein
VVDSGGTVFLLDKLNVKDNMINKSITLPPYVKDVEKVRMGCAFPGLVLGEASFAKPVALN